jgi:hypothetical protein
VRVYHFVPYGFGLEDLRHRRLKIARLDDLNDPFELLGFAAREPMIRKAFADTKARLARDRGLLCFSRDWHNPVQWSHYAEQHRGLCLGFDIPDEMLTEVTYIAKRPLPDMVRLAGTGLQAQAEMLRVLTTKFSHWRYENEVRVFVDLTDPIGSLYFADFGPSLALREVIVGARCEATRANIAAALGPLASAVKTRKARLAFRSFRVVEQKQRALWS